MAESIQAKADEARDHGRSDRIRVVVTFPLGPAGPYRDDLADEATVGTVRAAAMIHFGAVEDPGLRFYLVHDGLEVADTRTVGDVAGLARAVKFTLARDVIQG